MIKRFFNWLLRGWTEPCPAYADMTSEEFERGYCEGSSITLMFYREMFVTMSCSCEYEGCNGWAAIRNDPNAIEHQRMFHSVG